jgi:hypothetical protein
LLFCFHIPTSFNIRQETIMGLEKRERLS